MDLFLPPSIDPLLNETKRLQEEFHIIATRERLGKCYIFCSLDRTENWTERMLEIRKKIAKVQLNRRTEKNRHKETRAKEIMKMRAENKKTEKRLRKHYKYDS